MTLKLVGTDAPLAGAPDSDIIGRQAEVIGAVVEALDTSRHALNDVVDRLVDQGLGLHAGYVLALARQAQTLQHALREQRVLLLGTANPEGEPA